MFSKQCVTKQCVTKQCVRKQCEKAMCDKVLSWNGVSTVHLPEKGVGGGDNVLGLLVCQLGEGLLG
jgi:hypothetical protein